MLPVQPPHATELQKPMLKTSQVPAMDGRAMIRVLLSLCLTGLTAIHLGQAGLGSFPRMPHFPGKLWNPSEPQFPLFLNNAVLGSHFPASLREWNEIIIVPLLACRRKSQRSLQAIYWTSAAPEIKGKCLSHSPSRFPSRCNTELHNDGFCLCRQFTQHQTIVLYEFPKHLPDLLSGGLHCHRPGLDHEPLIVDEGPRLISECRLGDDSLTSFCPQALLSFTTHLLCPQSAPGLFVPPRPLLTISGAHPLPHELGRCAQPTDTVEMTRPRQGRQRHCCVHPAPSDGSLWGSQWPGREDT